jgi:hypothetical protein
MGGGGLCKHPFRNSALPLFYSTKVFNKCTNPTPPPHPLPLGALLQQSHKRPQAGLPSLPPCLQQDAPITGDSFLRVLLNVTPLQKAVAALLLERLPEFCGDGAQEDTGGGVAQLILGQFRWLDQVGQCRAASPWKISRK